MSKSQQKPAPSGRVWNAPRLVRIGTIADVAGASNQPGQTVSQVATKT